LAGKNLSLSYEEVMSAATNTRYSIPFNGDLRLMEESFETGRVWGGYFARPLQCDGSIVYLTNYRKFSDDKINRLSKLAQKYKVRTNLLFNSPFLKAPRL
jgi:hypothetical protein